MKRRTLSLCLSLTATTLVSSLPAKAASINFDDLQLISTRPIAFNEFLSFNGNPADNQGITGFLNPDPTAPDGGHFEITANSPPGDRAPYYTVGRQGSPEASGATRATSLEGGTGFSNFFDYINDNSLDLGNVGYGFGQKLGRDFTETWNLGDDLLGQDWLASPTSSVEERIYQADPNAVESFLVFNDIKFIEFNYSPFYVILDTGETMDFIDDLDIFITDAVVPRKASGLSPLLDGLAEAFLEDVNSRGGKVQLYVEDPGVPPSPPAFFDPVNSRVGFNVPFPLQIRVVNIPESSPFFGLVVVGVLGVLTKGKFQR